jgi:hypothetical protein
MGRYSLVSDIEAAYAAGILDGEGSISLTRNHSGRWPSPQVSVASTDRELVEWLKERFGGSISIKQPRKPQHSLSYDWKLTDRRALCFLQIVRHYLVLRRKILRCDFLLKAYLDCTPRNGRYTEKMLHQKQEFLEMFSSLT